MTKRPLSDLTISPEASVEGIVCSLSPMKKSKGCTYFDGVLGDGLSSVRFFGFNSMLHKQLLQFHEDGEGVLVDKCEIRKDTNFAPTGVEIMMGR